MVDVGRDANNADLETSVVYALVDLSKNGCEQHSPTEPINKSHASNLFLCLFMFTFRFLAFLFEWWLLS